MNSREEMEAALKTIVVPALRERGFTGSFPHFRRITGSVELLTFQFDRNGGGFLVESAKAANTEFVTHWGKRVPVLKLTAWDLHPNQRRRIKPLAGSGTDSWFRFDSKPDCEALARSALHLIVNEIESNQSPEPTLSSGTSRAGHDSRLP